MGNGKLRVFKGVESEHIPREIAEWCNQNFKYEFQVKLGEYISLNVATKSHNIPENINNIVGVIHSFILCFGIKKKLTIRIYPSPFKKQWNNKDKLTRSHVSSGFTIFDNYSADVVLWRSEEIYKVLAHELIHGFGLISRDTMLNTKKNLYEEAVVEAWATIIDTARRLSVNSNFRIPETQAEYSSTFQSNTFQKQLSFSIKQAKRILIYSKCTSLHVCKNSLPKNPPVLSYYIIKAAFLADAERFIKVFWWSQLKKCCILNDSHVLSFISPHFEELLEKLPHYKGRSMRMTLHRTLSN